MLCPIRARVEQGEFFPTARRGRRRTGTFRTSGRGYSESAAFTAALICAENFAKGGQSMGRNGALLRPDGGNWMSARGLFDASRTGQEGQEAGRRLPALFLYLLPNTGPGTAPGGPGSRAAAPLYLLPLHGAHEAPGGVLPWGTAAVPTLAAPCPGRRPRHGSTKKRVPFGHPLSICIAQFAFILVERVAGKPCQLHDLCV